MKERISVTLDKSLIDLLKNKRIKLSTHINQVLWRELALENDKEHFYKFNNIEYKNNTWQFKDKDTQLDKDFKYLYQIYIKNYGDFCSWLTKHSEYYQRNVKTVLEKSFKSHYRNFKDSLLKGGCSTKYYSLAFRNLINYAVERDLLRKSESIDIKNKLILKTSNIDSKVPTKTEIKALFDKVKSYSIEDYIFLRILFESGLRISDVSYFLERLNRNEIEVKGEIFIFPLYNLRGSKSSFYCIGLKETLDLILNNFDKMKEYNKEKLKTYIKRNSLLKLKYIRKYTFTIFIESEIEFNIADFIQGRYSQSVGFTRYLFQKKLAIKEYSKVVQTLRDYY